MRTRRRSRRNSPCPTVRGARPHRHRTACPWLVVEQEGAVLLKCSTQQCCSPRLYRTLVLGWFELRHRVSGMHPARARTSCASRQLDSRDVTPVDRIGPRVPRTQRRHARATKMTGSSHELLDTLLSLIGQSRFLPLMTNRVVVVGTVDSYEARCVGRVVDQSSG